MWKDKQILACPTMEHLLIIKRSRDFSGGPVVNNLPVNSEDMGSMPGPGRFHMPPGNQAHKMQLLQGRANLDSMLDLFLWLSDQFSRSVVSGSLQPYGLQHSKLHCPSPSPRAYSNSRPLSRWCYPNISSSVIPFSSHHQSFPASGSFPMESVVRIRWPKYWSFSFSIGPSNEYSGLISFRMDLLDLLAVQGTLKNLLQHYSSKASVLWH